MVKEWAKDVNHVIYFEFISFLSFLLCEWYISKYGMTEREVNAKALLICERVKVETKTVKKQIYFSLFLCRCDVLFPFCS